ncbi:MAG: hypothetical protein ABI036_01945 [Fibrobacteria bacterium]
MAKPALSIFSPKPMAMVSLTPKRYFPCDFSRFIIGSGGVVSEGSSELQPAKESKEQSSTMAALILFRMILETIAELPLLADTDLRVKNNLEVIFTLCLHVH